MVEEMSNPLFTILTLLVTRYLHIYSKCMLISCDYQSRYLNSHSFVNVCEQQNYTIALSSAKHGKKNANIQCMWSGLSSVFSS